MFRGTVMLDALGCDDLEVRAALAPGPNCVPQVSGESLSLK